MGVPWRVTKGAEPCAVKAASTVLNGEDEETGRKVLRLVLTQRNLRDDRLNFDLVGATQSNSHLTQSWLRALYSAMRSDRG